VHQETALIHKQHSACNQPKTYGNEIAVARQDSEAWTFSADD